MSRITNLAGLFPIGFTALIQNLKSKIRNPDALLSLLLFICGLYAYTVTLAPTVLEGDGALFQYTPYVLGVTYPTGFPLYILIGKVWLTLFPFGDIAWRMNFLSALCSAFALPFLYNAARHLFTSYDKNADPGASRWAALVAVFTFATLPTFWLWSTATKTYALNILLFSIILYLLAKALGPQNHVEPIAPTTSPLYLPALLLGLQISIHNTAVLLGPGLVLWAWLYFRPYLRPPKSFLKHLLLLMTPGLFYLYIPLRAQWLIAQYGQQEAIARGLLADFYTPGWQGLIRYYTAADFTGGVATNWGLVPVQFFSRYLPILTDNFTLIGAILGLVGGVALLLLRPRLFSPLFLIYAVPIPFVLAYGQGEQSAFLLPSFLILSLFIGYLLILLGRILRALSEKAQPTPGNVSGNAFMSRAAPPFLFLIFLLFLFIPQTRYNFNWLDAKWSRPTHAEWSDNLNHPLEEGATILARWGDLTSFWYMQYAENRRPDLRGLYPPTEAVVLDWYERGGGDLYIAGPLESWAEGVEDRYQLLPWGRLVRIAPRQVKPETLLPPLAHEIGQTFADRLHVLGVDYAPQAVDGSEFPVTLTWQALTELPPETTISLRLSQGEAIVTQIDDPLLSAWFPQKTLPSGQHLLTYPLLPIPLGTLPGKYRLQLVAYTSYKQPWTMPDGSTLLDLGQVEVVLPSDDHQVDTTTFETIAGHDFNGELRLADYDYSVRRVGQGKGFAVKMLWQTLQTPADHYTLRIEAVDAEGNLVRAAERQPVDGLAPTTTWQRGQFIRDQVDLVLPASAPVGPQALQIRLSWLRPDGSTLSVRRWWVPTGEQLTLDSLDVTEKEDRVFAVPDIPYAAEANLENKVRLLGYRQVDSEENSGLQLSQTGCAANAEACTLLLEFYWQGISEMDQLYFVFIHVVDDQGQIVAQHDRAPGKRGKQPTTSWLPQEIVADPVELSLPPDLSPGQYTLRLGMYLPPEGPRLLVLDDEEKPVADFVEVGTLKVTP